MTAQELTIICKQQDNILIELETDVKYLKSEVEKLRLLYEDLKTDVKQMEDSRK